MTLADLYRSASPTQLWAGKAWYRGAAAATVDLVGRAAGWSLPGVRWTGPILRRERCAALIALLSPRTPWKANVQRAIRCAEAYHREADPASTRGLFARVKPKVRAVFDPTVDPADLFDPMTAPKTSAFYRNLCGDLSAVTVDVWAARAAGWDPARMSDPAYYAAVASLYRDAAGIVMDDPASVQAVVWCVTRGANGVLREAPRWFGLPSTVT